MKALVVGYGSIGKRHCRLLQAVGLSSEDIYIAELRESRVADAHKAGHSLFTLGSDQSFDIAVVASSTSSHIGVLSNLPVTKLIYIEKPLAHDYLKVAPVARRLSKASKDCKIVVGYMLRHHPAVQQVKELIAANTFGKLLKYRWYVPSAGILGRTIVTFICLILMEVEVLC